MNSGVKSSCSTRAKIEHKSLYFCGDADRELHHSRVSRRDGSRSCMRSRAGDRHSRDPSSRRNGRICELCSGWELGYLLAACIRNTFALCGSAGMDCQRQYSVLRTEGNSMEMPHTSQSEFKDETEPGISIYQTGENGWDVSVWAITIDDTEYRASEYSENITCSLPVALDSVVLGTFVRVP